MSDKKKYTHVWLAPCTGSKGLLLRTDKPFDASEHDYISIVDAVAAGKAKPLKESDAKVVSVEAKPATEADFLPKASPKPTMSKKGK